MRGTDAKQNLHAKIFFLDIPSLIDSAWRVIDFRANAERCYQSGALSVGVNAFAAPLVDRLRKPS